MRLQLIETSVTIVNKVYEVHTSLGMTYNQYHTSLWSWPLPIWNNYFFVDLATKPLVISSIYDLRIV